MSADYCRPARLEWRCRRIHDFIVAIRNAMKAIRSDLLLTLDIWREPNVPAIRQLFKFVRLNVMLSNFVPFNNSTFFDLLRVVWGSVTRYVSADFDETQLE